MEKQTRTLTLFMVAALATVGLAACSGTSDQSPASTTATAAHGTRDPAQRAAVTTSAAAPVENHGGMKVVGSQPDRQYLHDLMQEPDFADAFASMDGAKALPAWVNEGGTAVPAKEVSVGGQSRLLAQACKPHDCPSEKIVLLYDKSGHAMQGVFVRDPAPSPDAGISGQAQYTWLGSPDETTRAWLKKTLISR
ncbi:MAG TPA: Ivy family c-type lysozyme inhibitor [Oleiagrimonas sp.]|nr:Ivy family c-type lysozyme inhibitor [Oleiagrimonas sp.]